MSDISYSKFLIKSKFNPKKAKKYMESYDKIMESGLFDKNYYLKAYPHIAKSGMDPLVHYLFYGYKEDKNPSAQFNLKRYLEEYLLNREQIRSLVQLVDGRHELQKNDIQMREWVNAYEIPIFTIVTKMDYVPKNKVLNVLKSVEKQFGGVVLPFSAIDRRYCDDIFAHLLELSNNKEEEIED